MPQKYFVYILEASDGKYYTGYTSDLSKRMDRHKNGIGAKFTRGFGFRRLLYYESYPTKSEALKREAQLKGWPRAKKKALISCNPLRQTRGSEVMPGP